MGWKSVEFGDSHEGWTGALLADRSEPGPVYLDAGSGSHMEKTRERHARASPATAWPLSYRCAVPAR